MRLKEGMVQLRQQKKGQLVVARKEEKESSKKGTIKLLFL